MNSKQRGFIAGEAIQSSRLDSALAELFPETPRSVWKKRIIKEEILVDGSSSTPAYKLKIGDAVTIVDIVQERAVVNIPVLYEDDDVIVINKPAGVLSHAKSSEIDEVTVASYFADRIEDSLTNSRAGIVHRLDRDTSGVMVIARTKSTLDYLQKQFANRTVEKTYVAVVSGKPKDKEAILKWPIERNPKQPSTFRVGAQGKPAETYYQIVKSSAKHSFLELKPKTGRTHQLRVHLKELGYPIVGDRLYGRESGTRLMLHAQRVCLAIKHDDYRCFEADLPPDFEELLA